MSVTDLSDADLALWISAVKAVPDDGVGLLFMEWFEGPLRRFFPFEKALLVHGELTAGQIKMTHLVSSGHDAKYLRQLSKSFELTQRGALRWWLANQQPFGIDSVSHPAAFATDFELQEIRTFDLGRVAAHGVVNIKANAGTYFSFSGIPIPLSGWHWNALRLIAPVLNSLFIAYIRAIEPVCGPAFENLTSRQREIVRQLADGLSDKAIGRNLHISEKTVRNQLTTIYSAVGLKSRARLLSVLR